MATPNAPRVSPTTTTADVAPGLSAIQVVRLSLLTGLFASGRTLSKQQIDQYLSIGEELVMQSVAGK